MPSRESLWTGYLDSTLLAPVRAVAILAPAAGFAVAGIVLWDLSWIQVLLLGWAWTHLVDAVGIVRDPVEFGLRLWFPPLVERGRQGDQAALALTRMTIMFDVAFGAIRATFGLVPSSVPLFALTVVSVVVQFVMFTLERKANTADWRAAYIGRAGAVILGAAVIAHAALGGLRWD